MKTYSIGFYENGIATDQRIVTASSPRVAVNRAMAGYLCTEHNRDRQLKGDEQLYIQIANAESRGE